MTDVLHDPQDLSWLDPAAVLVSRDPALAIKESFAPDRLVSRYATEIAEAFEAALDFTHAHAAWETATLRAMRGWDREHWLDNVSKYFSNSLQGQMAKILFNAAMVGHGSAARDFQAGLITGEGTEYIQAWANTYAKALTEDLTLQNDEAVKQSIYEYVNGRIGKDAIVDRIKIIYGLDPRAANTWRNFFARTLKDKKFNRNVLSPDTAVRFALTLMDHRKKTVSQTGTFTAINFGRQLMYQYAMITGVLDKDERKVWLTAIDERVCPVCAPMDLVGVPMTESFELPNTNPQGRHNKTKRNMKVVVPPVHPNCRCTIVPESRLRGGIITRTARFSSDENKRAKRVSLWDDIKNDVEQVIEGYRDGKSLDEREYDLDKPIEKKASPAMDPIAKFFDESKVKRGGDPRNRGRFSHIDLRHQSSAGHGVMTEQHHREHEAIGAAAGVATAGVMAALAARYFRSGMVKIKPIPFTRKSSDFLNAFHNEIVQWGLTDPEYGQRMMFTLDDSQLYGHAVVHPSFYQHIQGKTADETIANFHRLTKNKKTEFGMAFDDSGKVWGIYKGEQTETRIMVPTDKVRVNEIHSHPINDVLDGYSLAPPSITDLLTLGTPQIKRSFVVDARGNLFKWQRTSAGRNLSNEQMTQHIEEYGQKAFSEASRMMHEHNPGLWTLRQYDPDNPYIQGAFNNAVWAYYLEHPSEYFSIVHWKRLTVD